MYIPVICSKYIDKLVNSCLLCFVLMLLNIPVNSNDHVWTVASDFVEIQPDVEMNDISSPAITHSQVDS